MTQTVRLLSVATATCAAGCLFVSSFDRFDPDAPDLVRGDAGTIQVPADADGPFRVRVEAPASIDTAQPGTLTVDVERDAPTPLRITLAFSEGVRVLPSSRVDLDATTPKASFVIDVAEAPRGAVKGTIRVERIDGSAAQTVEVAIKTTGAGDLDTTFGDGGVIVFGAVGSSLDPTTAVRGVALTADQKIVVAGSVTKGAQTSWKLARLGAAGLDPTFGVAGTVVEALSSYGGAHAPILRAGGLWVGGAVSTGSAERFDMVVRRYSADGAFVASTTVLNVEANPPSSLVVNAPDGVWLAAWDRSHFDVPLEYQETIVAKLDDAGNVVVGPLKNRIPMRDQWDLGHPARGLDQCPGDLELVGGRLLHTAVTYSIFESRRPIPARIAGYLTSGPSAGMLDPTFGNAGLAETSGLAANEVQVAAGIAPRSDGSFVVVGGRSTESRDFTYERDRMLARRFSASGIVDGSFEDPLAPCEGILLHATTDAANRTVAVGYFGPANPSASARQTIAVLRLRPNGAIDRTFGSARLPGVACAEAPGFDGARFAGLEHAVAERVLLDGAGRVVVVGRGQRASATEPLGEDVMFVARFRN